MVELSPIVCAEDQVSDGHMDALDVQLGGMYSGCSHFLLYSGVLYYLVCVLFISDCFLPECSVNLSHYVTNLCFFDSSVDRLQN